MTGMPALPRARARAFQTVGCGTRCSVINVNWVDAKQYVGRLSQVTGKDYHLLSEAEWEYVARAGGVLPGTSWGDYLGKNNANCDGCGSPWDLQQTAPAGSFKPNAFGLYDVHGNVWEWVEDTWHENYDGAPAYVISVAPGERPELPDYSRRCVAQRELPRPRGSTREAQHQCSV